MATVNIVIEGDDSGVSNSLNRINQQAAQLGAGFSQAATASDQATSRMSTGFERSRESARLLREETGIFLPRALQGLIAQSQVLGPILNTAFSGLAVVGFVQILGSVPKAIDAVIEKMTGWKKAADDMAASQGALNKALLEMNTQIESSQRKGAVIGMSALGTAQTNLGFSQSDLARQQALVTSLSQQLATMRGATMTVPGGIGPSGEIIAPMTVGADLTGTKEFSDLTAQLEEAQAKLKLLKQEAANAQAEVAKIGSQDDIDQLMAMSKQFDDLIKKNQEYAAAGQKTMDEMNRQMIDDMEAQQKADEYWRQQDNEGRSKTMQSLDEQMMANIEADQKVVLEGQKAAEEYARSWTRARDTMANELDSFFNEITSGNIGQAFLKQFEKLVSQMVATWLMGVNGIQQGVTRSGGLFGSLFGIGGPSGDGTVFSGSQGGGVFNLSNGFTGPEASMLGLPLSAGGGGGSVGLSGLPAGAATIAAGGGKIGGLFSLFSLSNLTKLLPLGALAGGSALLGQGGVLGALGSGLTGFGAGAVAGPLLTSLAESGFLSGAIGAGTATTLATIGSFLGPIGAGIGLIAGLVGLFTGNGKLKIQQSQLVQQMERDIAQVKNSYDLHQTDYNSAIAADEQIRQSYTQQQEQLKKGGSVGRVDQWINDAEAAINSTEQQRQNAIAAAANFGPAQFRTGGYVDASLSRFVPGFVPAMHFASGGAVPAMLHAGEFVMRPEAVQRVGVGTLKAMNSGGYSGGDIHIHAVDAQSFEQALQTNRVAFIRMIRRAAYEGAI